MPLGVAVNTAVSFLTNTNWQAYSGEASLSYLTQMAGLGVQNFLSAATGLAVMAALARGFSRRSAAGLGNFWADLVRSTLYVLLPLSFAFALVLVAQGVVQSFAPYPTATTLAGAEQVIPLGPAASQIAIKQLGTNGGGFFGLNSAHPFENPTALSNFLQTLAILALPAACVYAYGLLVGARRHAWVVYGVMLAFFVATLGLSLWSEYATPGAATLALEGKEVRFGVTPSILWASATTVASNGSVNAMHSSLSPLAGGLALFNMLLGEIIFGGIGSGLYGMVMVIVLAVFLAGLMVGRTPEYLGKKIESFEVRMAAVAVLLPCAAVLFGCAVSFASEAGRGAVGNAGPHALSEILYAWGSMANNNGSAFGSLTATGDLYTWGGSLAMLIGRFGVILPVLALAGRLAAKKTVPASSGTFPVDGLLFAGLLAAVIFIVAALTYFPALTLGPGTRTSPPHRRPHLLNHPELSSLLNYLVPETHFAMKPSSPSTWDAALLRRAALDAFRKLNPRELWRNPVIFVTALGATAVTVTAGRDLLAGALTGFTLQITLWLWFTVLFATFAEAIAEGRGKAQADSLKRARAQTFARRLRDGVEERVAAPDLRKGDIVVCETRDVIPADGEVIEGIASVDESAITGESAPVVRESGGDRSAVTGGTRVLSDRIVVRITVEPGAGFLDRMIGLVEGASRQRTPQRDRARHPAGRADRRVPGRRGYAPFLRPLQRNARRPGRRGRHVAARPRVALRVPDSHHHRRPAQRHRHQRHRPAHPPQRHRHLRPRGRGRRRHRRAAPRQDRHHHPRQPPGRGIRGRPRHRPRAPRLGGATRVPRGRNPRGPQHRRAGQGKIQPARARGRLAARHLCALRRGNPHERCRPRRSQHSQGRRRQRPCLGGGAGWLVPGRSRRCGRTHRAGRRHPARRGREPRGARRHPAEGRRQGRHQGTLRRTPSHGHPHRDDHWRQSSDRRSHRR